MKVKIPRNQIYDPNEISVSYKRKKIHSINDFFLFSCHVTDFLAKFIQLVFIVYVLFIDKDIAAFISKYKLFEHDYLYRIMVDLDLAFIFLNSSRDYIKTQKKIFVWSKSRKYGSQIKIPISFRHYKREGFFEILTMIGIIALIVLMHFVNGINLGEAILTISVIVVYSLWMGVHIINGIFSYINKRTVRKREIEQVLKYW
ncbi:MAG: hypothetical protein E7275_12820 [Pseudobutyrivibrio sp.]|uniref:hypothetical protein n=1 Tax=Pseudobutyrivibrio sp. TaxID=2014367 RepID=UPI0025F4F47E|nr:hypothetical protein [Pseudobutyrivibrio sp.]MBE5905149.1 hypothetical protein [Pseudobutyrivibrio sp.]